MKIRLILILLSLTVLTKPCLAAAAPQNDAKLYHHAFAAIAANNPAEAENLAAHGTDAVLNKVITGYAMALPGNDYSFEQLNGFMTDNPGWPGLKAIQMIAEQKIPANAAPASIVAWFTAHPPVTLSGFYRYFDALNLSGMGGVAQSAVRARWVDGDFNGDELTAFGSRFGALLDQGAVWARMDRLLWKNNEADARRLMPMLSASDQSVATARLALAAQQGDAQRWLSRVPADRQDDPGLQYQKLRWLVKNNRDDDAADLLQHAPAELGKAEAWWEQRQVIIRRAMEHHDYALAFQLATQHGQTDAKPLVQAEFLCGWLALRFLDKPDLARQHFQILYDKASTPISRARGAYWLGRSYEAMGDKNAAEQSYEDAAAFNTAYYGQLAATRIYAAPVLTAKADPPLPDAVRRGILARDLIRAILRLSEISEDERARSFFHAAVEAADERAEFIILTEIAAKLHRPDLGIQTVKAAGQKDMLIYNGGFPLIDQRVPTPPEPAFTHALIRQESLFNVDAESSTGARGLMQLMPGTAKDTARKIDLRYSQTRLSDPAYNMKLGTAFVQQQIDHFNGSYILALAGYNAGPGRVREWLTTFGDPRTADIDPVDWVELIPIQETRNYVQRIIENLQIYRAKLAGGHAPLQILSDLKR